jgi:phosphatidylinositol alpha-1,6-mannosyltransferase
VGFIWCGNLRPAGYVAAWTRRREGVRYGVLVHGGDLLQLRAKYRRSPFKRRAARGILGGADLLVANSQWTGALAGEILAELGLGAGPRIAVVPLGADPDRFRPGLDPAPAAARYRIPPGRYLLTVGRLVPHKGCDTALEALAVIRRRHPDVRLVLVGRGPDRSRLEPLTRRLGLESAVSILSEVPDSDLPALYAGAAVYVGLSREEGLDVEGFGIALADAAAAAVPVVAGASGGTGDAVRDGETGFRVSPRDPGAVADAVLRLLENPDLANRLGLAGRRWVETYLNWDRVVADLIGLSRSAARSARR